MLQQLVIGMQRQLTPRDIDVLRALSLGTAPDVRSNHRLRLELLGLVRDGATGLRLTAAGKEAIEQLAATDAEDCQPVEDSERCTGPAKR